MLTEWTFIKAFVDELPNSSVPLTVKSDACQGVPFKSRAKITTVAPAAKINLTFSNQTAERTKQLEAEFQQQRKVSREGGIRKYTENSLGEPTEATFNYVNAGKFVLLGDKEKALKCLEKAYEQRAFLAAFIKADPILEDLRDEPRYREILRKMNLE